MEGALINQRNPVGSSLCSRFIIFPTFHYISLPGNVFGVLILDMGEGEGKDFLN